MKVLVTGHNGYIGSVLVPMLEQAGHEVCGLDNYLFDACTFGDVLPDIAAQRMDIRNLEAGHLQGMDAVIHLAGLCNDPLGDLNPELTHAINHKAAVHVAKLAKQVGVKRFLHSSTCSLCAGGAEFLDESAEFNPVTPYGAAKVKVEADVARLADQNFSPVFLRSGTAYGVSSRLRGDLVINNLVGYAYTTGEVLIKSDGTPWRPLVHIEDIAAAFIAALQAPRESIHNQAFNVGQTQENYQVSEIAEMVCAIVPNSKVRYAQGAGPDKRTYKVNCDKIRHSLPGFKPRWSARKGIEELYGAYHGNRLTLDSFLSGRFSRIRHIFDLQQNGCLDAGLYWLAPTT